MLSKQIRQQMISGGWAWAASTQENAFWFFVKKLEHVEDRDWSGWDGTTEHASAIIDVQLDRYKSIKVRISQ